MRLSAQRLVSLDGQRRGINAFCYSHGPYVWLDEPPEEIKRHRGHLVNSAVELAPPGGNTVLSYIDILASDSTPNARIIHDVRQCIGLLAERNLPMRVQSGDTHFTFDLEPTLAPAWRRELEILLQYAISVRVPF